MPAAMVILRLRLLLTTTSCRHGPTAEPSASGCRPLALRPRLATGLPFPAWVHASISAASPPARVPARALDGCRRRNAPPGGRQRGTRRVGNESRSALRRRPAIRPASVGAAYHVPTTNRINGPKLIAAGAPAKYSPPTDEP